ncbi:MAG: MOSC domain-containing protein [Planctomyces sp.]|nr:MOSC domain-containing protein [Planctomyces sp.]
MEILKDLLGRTNLPGRVEWIGISPRSRAPISSVPQVEALQNAGLTGDHHQRPENRSKRQVTLIQFEHIAVVEAILGGDVVVIPELLRRNIVVSGINLGALRYQRFRIGDCVLSGTGSCPPCSRMEENLGPGGYAAMLGHGGITAVVEQTGTIRIGDSVIAEALSSWVSSND